MKTFLFSRKGRFCLVNTLIWPIFELVGPAVKSLALFMLLDLCILWGLLRYCIIGRPSATSAETRSEPPKKCNYTDQGSRDWFTKLHEFQLFPASLHILSLLLLFGPDDLNLLGMKLR